MAQTNTSAFINFVQLIYYFGYPLASCPCLKLCLSPNPRNGLSLNLWPPGMTQRPWVESVYSQPPVLIPQQSELFFQGNEQTGWWSSSPHYIMFLRTSPLQREEKKSLFSRPILLGRQTDSTLAFTEACCSHLLTEPSPKPPCRGHSLCSWKMAFLVGRFGMSFLQARSFRRLKKCDISGLLFCAQQLHFKGSLE